MSIEAIAYSYVRFSTPEQQRGDSYRRQVAAARAYADRHNLRLDESMDLADLGLSAYRGANSEQGKLGEFLAYLRAGRIPQGSFLLVESLDRISRQSARRALRTLEDIIEGGVTVVTLFDERVYDLRSLEGIDLLVALLYMIRANEESATKARRLRHAWESKRVNAAAGTSVRLTSIAPAWLTSTTTGFEVNENAGEIIRSIFKLALEGHGRQAIASILNERGVKPIHQAAPDSKRRVALRWYESYVGKILTSRAVIGEFVPHTEEYVDGRMVRSALEPIEGYFPSVVDPEVWSAVQALRGSRKPRNLASSPVGKKNPLGGLLHCYCGRPVVRASKGKGPLGQEWSYYICFRNKERGALKCNFPRIRAEQLENHIVDSLPAILKACPVDGNEGRQLRWDMGGLEALISQKQSAIDTMLREIEAGSATSPSLLRKIDSLEAEISRLKAELSEFRARLDALAPGVSRERALRLAQAMINGPVDMSTVNAVCRTVFTRCEFAQGHRELSFRWRNGGVTELALPEFVRAKRATPQPRAASGRFK